MKDRADYVCDWCAKVASDMRAVQVLIAPLTAVPEAACFHCQQAVEKVLKAWLVWRGMAAPRTHDISTRLNW